MGIVSEHLVGLIAKQVEERSLVVWYDPGADYLAVAKRLEIPGTTIARYDGSFLKLRREIDTLLNELEPQSSSSTCRSNRPTRTTPWSNSKRRAWSCSRASSPSNATPGSPWLLATHSRTSSAMRMPPRSRNRLTKASSRLKDVDALGLKGQDITQGVVSIIFGTGNSQEVALAFLASDRLDADIEKKSAITELVGLLQSTFEVELPEKATLANIRERLTRHILMTDLVVGLGNKVPSSLASIKIAETPAAIAACTGLARSWRLRRDVRESYIAVSQKVEQDFSLSKLTSTPRRS